MPVARAFAYVLLVVVCTVVAAAGGYAIGVRTNPSDETTTVQRADAVQDAVRRAVARQRATDRKLRRDALRDAMAWQRDKYLAVMRRRLDAQRLADAKQAVRAYARGRAAGRVAAERRAAEKDARRPGGDRAVARERTSAAR